MPESQHPTERLHSVLIVEDDHGLADLLCEVLVYENCEPEVATNGMDALQKIRTGNYEAVITDLMMPVVGGEALYRIVAKEYPYLADRFLFMTSETSLRGGSADFINRTSNTLLAKPIEMDQLRAALRDLFQR